MMLWGPHAVMLPLVVGAPLWDRAETRRLKRATGPRARVQSYARTMAVLWTITLVLLLVVPAPQLLHPFASQCPPDSVRFASVPILLGLLLGLAVPVLVARTNARVRARLAQPLQSLAWFLPCTPRDRVWFAALAVSAGVCEELIYRGFLLGYLGGPPLGLGVPASVAVATLVFVLGHTYQGWLGRLAVGVLGALFSVLYLVTGSLWAAMLVHALVDLRILLFWPTPLARPETRPSPTQTVA